MLILRPGDRINSATTNFKIYLNGCPNNEQWYADLIKAFEKRPVTLLDPRIKISEYSKPDWKYEYRNASFQHFESWKFAALHSADVVLFYFSNLNPSPMSLLDLGSIAESDNVFVCYDKDYKFVANLEYVCERYGIPMINNTSTFLKVIIKKVDNFIYKDV